MGREHINKYALIIFLNYFNVSINAVIGSSYAIYVFNANFGTYGATFS